MARDHSWTLETSIATVAKFVEILKGTKINNGFKFPAKIAGIPDHKDR